MLSSNGSLADERVRSAGRGAARRAAGAADRNADAVSRELIGGRRARFSGAGRCRASSRMRTMAELVVNESTNAEEPEALVAYDELPVRERNARPALHRALVARDDAKRRARRMRKQVRCRVLHAHSKIRRRHLHDPFGFPRRMTRGRKLPRTHRRMCEHSRRSICPFRGMSRCSRPGGKALPRCRVAALPAVHPAFSTSRRN